MTGTLTADVREALDVLREGLESLYGDRLKAILLYGSQARGDARLDSDVDVAVVLDGPVRDGAEIERTSLLRQQVNLRTGRVVSCVYVTPEALEQEGEAVYRSIRREGVVA